MGIAADLIDLVTARIPLPFTLHVTKNWEESVAASKAGQCQISSFLNQTPERETWLIFTEPLLTDPNVLIVREDMAPFGDLSLVKGLSIAIPKAASVYYRVQKDYPNLRLIGTDSEYEAFEMVSNRKADMTLRSRIVAGENIKKKGWFNLKIANELPGYENQLRMGVLKSEPLLRDLLNRGIALMTLAERESIVNRYVEIKMVTRVETDYTLVGWLAALMVTFVVTSLFWMQRLRGLNTQLKTRSETDALTGLRNRTGLTMVFEQDIDRAHRYGRPLAMILLDLDHFKRVNDSFGHLVGDKVLVEFAQLLQATTREADAVYRWGGEEFLLICHETPPKQVLQLAQRILERVRQHTFPTQNPMTVSAGVATLQAHDTIDSLTQRADDALYRAKKEGRDRVCMAPETAGGYNTQEAELQPVAPLVWHPAFESGQALMDAQHRIIFNDTNQLCTAIRAAMSDRDVGLRVDALLHSITQHFKDEELLIAQSNSNDAGQHADVHRQLLQQAGESVRQYHAGQLTAAELYKLLAHEVVVRHILVEDR